jgi:5-bromo-4-chloroindolyl phosphate hydrolysis protein
MTRKKKTDNSGLIAGLLSAVVFLILFFVVDLGFFAIAGAVVSYLGFILIFSPGKNQKEITIISDGLSQEDYEEIIDSVQSKANNMKDLINKMPYGNIKKKSEAVLNSVYKIILELKKDPDDVRRARDFLTYYLDTTIKIMHKYLDIGHHKNVEDMLIRVESIMDSLEAAFEKQLSKLIENDLLDLDTELDLLKSTLKSQGLE